MYIVGSGFLLGMAGDDEACVLTTAALTALRYPVVMAAADQRIVDEAKARLGEEAARVLAERAATMSVNELNDVVLAAFDRLIAAHDRLGDAG